MQNKMNNHPHIIEMVGVAGTGKSTLRKAMMQRDKRIQFFDRPGNLSYLPFIFKLATLWLPLYLTYYRNSKWFSTQEIRNMGYLDTWISRIRYRALFNDNIYIIEPGSVYWLATLQECKVGLVKHPRFQRWWKKSILHWASSLDAIIWLDAPEEVCFKRVHSRDQWHQFLEISTDNAMQELKCYRNYYESLVPEMASLCPIKVFHFRTDQISTDQMVEQIFSDAELMRKLNQPSRDVKANL
jgi:shikimate kinase